MIDPLQIHHEEQKSYFEMREQFREEHNRDLKSRLRPLIVKRRNPRTGEWEMVDTGYLTDGSVHVPDFTFSDDGRITYDGTQTFGLDAVPFNLTEKLFAKAEESGTFEAMSLPEGEGFEHDGPVLLQPIEHYTEVELIQYVDRAIEASKEKR